MRIAIGQLWQETNTLNPIATTRADFEEFGVCRGADLVEQMAEVNELGGFIQSLRTWPEQPEIVGLVRLPAWPSGTATAETFDWIRDEVMNSLEAAIPVDGVLLALHGSMVTDQHPDVEGEILQAVRKCVGRQTPIVATLDLHANLTREMVEAADVLVPYLTMPHVDVFETGERGAAVLRRILIDGAKPTTAFIKIPAVIPPELSSTEAKTPKTLRRITRDFDQGIDRWMVGGILPVQPWLDIPQLGSSVLVTCDAREGGTKPGWYAWVQALTFWESRHQYIADLMSVTDAVEQAHCCEDGLVVLSDAADATTSGAPGDSVWILKELLKHMWPREALVTIVAPEVVSQCEHAGSGEMLQVELGGIRDNRFGTRVTIEAVVERCFDARFVMSGHLSKNMPIDMGRSAVLRHENNVYVVVTSRTGPHFAPEFFRAAGFEPFEASVVVAKSPCGFRAVYENHAAAIYNVKAPGCAPSDFWNYEFKNIPRPLWPWDEIEEWTPEVIIPKSAKRP
jgi:microcystin degradation protein MlrC